jgi:hypothetical protein
MKMIVPFISINTQMMMRIISKSVRISLLKRAIAPQIMLIIAMVELNTIG